MAKTPIVEQLQQDALDSDISMADLLRKAKVVAKKLDLKETVEWIEHELNGYPNGIDVPGYREIQGEPRALNHYRGWIPIMISDDEIQRMISSKPIAQSVKELELLSDGEGPLNIPLSPSQVKTLSEAAGEEPTQMAIFCSRSTVAGILDVVRNRVLDWGLNLERAGIKGDGLSFSEKEKEIVGNSPVNYQIHNIEHFSGNIGPVSGGGVVIAQQVNEAQIEKIRDLAKQVAELGSKVGLEGQDRSEFDGHLLKLDEELSNDQPDISKIKGFLKKIKKIAENVSGNVVATGIVELIKPLL